MNLRPPSDEEDAGPQQELFAIRDVAEATGISPDTIRVWERRYGWPKPVRLPSGHRRYTREQVRWLRRVAEALAHGHRPSHVLGLEELDFDHLIKNLAPTGEPVDERESMLQAVRDFREAELRQLLMDHHRERGTNAFLAQIVTPLINHTGRAWSDGVLQIRHEHFLTQLLEDVLRTLRVAMIVNSVGATIVLTTLAGERHDLGLQIAALVCADRGFRPRLLGTETPLEEIAGAARESTAAAVGISVSLATGGVDTDRALRDLRKQLPAEIRLVVGGMGARGIRRGPAGIDYLPDLESLGKWLETLVG